MRITPDPPPGHRSRIARPAWVDGISAEWDRLTSEPLARLRRGRLPLAFASTLTVLALWWLQHTAAGARIVGAIGHVSPATPLTVAMLRLPASMYAPAPNLPVWGSLLQVFAAFGVAEAWVGRRHALTIALTGTFLCTLSGRLLCALGPDFVIGVRWLDRYTSDTGPSAAVIALAVYVCCARRAPRTLAVIVAAMLGEIVLLPDLAGWEHLVAVAFGLLAAAVAPAADRLHRLLPHGDLVRPDPARLFMGRPLP